jgi:hypothetical protein
VEDRKVIGAGQTYWTIRGKVFGLNAKQIYHDPQIYTVDLARDRMVADNLSQTVMTSRPPLRKSPKCSISSSDQSKYPKLIRFVLIILKNLSTLFGRASVGGISHFSSRDFGTRNNVFYQISLPKWQMGFEYFTPESWQRQGQF